MKNVYEIKKSPLDREFREICTKLISEAEESVYVIAGELGSLKLPDMQIATAEAVSKRNVSGYAYATDFAPITLQNYAVSIGCKLYIGKKGLREHYLVVDRKHVVQSEDKIPRKNTEIGTRCGKVYYDDPKKADEVIKIFNELKTQAHEINSINKRSDRFYQFIHNL